MASYTEAELDELEPLKFFIPFAKSLADTGNTGRRFVAGVASTGEKDAQAESVLQKGIDFSPLLERGFVNWNHQPGPENIIGQPLEARIVKHDGEDKFWTKSELFRDHPRADAAWNLLGVLEKARQDGDSDRRLGWSVEGGILERRGSLIAKSVVRQLALTHEPVNFGTFAQLAKSIALAKAGAASTSGNYPPLLLQNLAGTDNRKAALVKQALFGKKPDQCQTELGRFKKGRIGMFEHMVEHEGWSIDEAKDVVIGLFKSLTS